MNKVETKTIINRKPAVHISCIETISELCDYYETEKLINKILAKHTANSKKEAFLVPIQEALNLLKESIQHQSALLDKVKNNNGYMTSSKKPEDEETKAPIKYPKYKSYFAPLLSDLVVLPPHKASHPNKSDSCLYGSL